MKTAYFQCNAGISGDMILGALVDAGLDLAELKGELAGLGLTGYQLTAETVRKNGIKATRVQVILLEKQQHHRHLDDIRRIILGAQLPETVKAKSVEIFQRLAEAEARVHHTTPDKIHFHEVGAVDALVDIVGSVLGLARLGIEEVIASPVNTGEGFVHCAHGILPVPAPATLELLKGVPVYSSGIAEELTTPTGAAILTSFCLRYSSLPAMEIDAVGYGAGGRDLPMPNVLRVLIGRRYTHWASPPVRCNAPPADLRQEEALVLEANIDDMNPEYYDHLMGKFFAAGAMDVFLQPIQMKKNRPAVTLSLLIPPDRLGDFAAAIFAETTTLGFRVYPVTKYMVPYEIINLETSLGEARVKIGRYGGKICNLAPEYEDCRRIAGEKNLPLKNVYEQVKREIKEKVKER